MTLLLTVEMTINLAPDPPAGSRLDALTAPHPPLQKIQLTQVLKQVCEDTQQQARQYLLCRQP